MVPYHFKGRATAGAFLLDHDDTIKRLLFLAKTGETNHQHLNSTVGRITDRARTFPKFTTKNLRRQITEWKSPGQLHLTELFAHEATRETLHHLPGLRVLLQQLVDILHGSSAPLGDPAAAASIDNHVIIAFARRHRI